MMDYLQSLYICDGQSDSLKLKYTYKCKRMSSIGILLTYTTAIMEDQDEFITRKLDSKDVASEANNKAILEDIGCNASIKRTIFKIRRLTSALLSSASKFRSSTMLAQYQCQQSNSNSNSVIVIVILVATQKIAIILYKKILIN